MRIEIRENSTVGTAGSLHIHPVYRHRFLSKTLTVLFHVCSGSMCGSDQNTLLGSTLSSDQAGDFTAQN